MQKQVSKQSLAVLALSILLAISMALTATFAAFSATGSAKGVITFDSVGVTLTYDASQDAATAGVQISYEGNATAGNEVTVAFARAAFELNDDKDGFVSRFIPWCSCHEPRRNIFSGNVARYQSLCDLLLAWAESLNVSFSWQEPFTA